MRILLFLFWWMISFCRNTQAQPLEPGAEARVYRLNGISLQSELKNQFRNTLNVLGLPEGFSLRLTKQLGQKIGQLTLNCHGRAVHQGYVVLLQEGDALEVTAPPFPRLNTALPLPTSSHSTYTWQRGFWLESQGSAIHDQELDFTSGIRWKSLGTPDTWDEEWLFRSHADTLRKAAVFRPDPSSRLRTPYGGFLRDRSDSNSIWLTQALDTISIAVLFEADSFRLRNSFLHLGEYSEPVRPQAKIDTGHFLFTRDQYFFEEVNVYAHISHFRQYLDQTGFSELAHYPLKVDAHGLNGADMSAYSPVSDILAFGEGNVDDAEDAAVIIHEYGHVLGQASIPFGNSGLQRKAIEEGICDYLAGSFCKQFSDWNWFNLFKWDGHNEFWSGRTLLSTKFYPTNLVGQIHRDGEIFSAFLTQLELLIGRDPTHTLILSALPHFIPEISMPQAAKILLATDSVLFQGQYALVLSQLMTSRGIHPSQVIVSELKSDRYLPYRLFWYQGRWKMENSGSETLKVECYAMNGQKVGKTLEIQPFMQAEPPPIIGPPGQYFLRLFTNSQSFIEKIRIQP